MIKDFNFFLLFIYFLKLYLSINKKEFQSTFLILKWNNVSSILH